MVLASVIAAGAIALGLAMAGVTPSAPFGDVAEPTAPPADIQTANSSVKADIEIHANRETKQDRLDLAEPVVPAIRFTALPLTPRELLHDSFAAIDLPRTPPALYAALPPILPEPAPPKSPIEDLHNPLLNDAQIEGIRKRLKLTPAQNRLWPAVRAALHDVILAHAARQKRARRGEHVVLDPNSAEVGRLKAAALPLLAQLRADQKRELQMLARIVGLESALARL